VARNFTTGGPALCHDHTLWPVTVYIRTDSLYGMR